MSFYDKQITNESREELKKFVNWMNKIQGNYPIVIGGWAVHSYTKGEMSQDIDVIIYDEETYFRRVEEEYLPLNGFIQYNKDTEDAFWGKQVVDSQKQKIIIQFDTILADKKHKIRNLGIIKDWSLVIENQQEADLDELKIYVPTRELLIVQKIIAALERGEDLKIESRAGIRRRLSDKIRKDYLDIASLIKIGELDKKTLKNFYDVCKLKPHIDRFIAGYERDYSDILESTSITLNSVKNAIIID